MSPVYSYGPLAQSASSNKAQAAYKQAQAILAKLQEQK